MTLLMDWLIRDWEFTRTRMEYIIGRSGGVYSLCDGLPNVPHYEVWYVLLFSHLLA